jgi:hypothetical protein
MKPPSTTPYKHTLLVGKSTPPHKTLDYVELGVPQHIAQIGAWNRGNRFGYGNSPFPSDKEAKGLTCSAYGGQGTTARDAPSAT